MCSKHKILHITKKSKMVHIAANTSNEEIFSIEKIDDACFEITNLIGSSIFSCKTFKKAKGHCARWLCS